MPVLAVDESGAAQVMQVHPDGHTSDRQAAPWAAPQPKGSVVPFPAGQQPVPVPQSRRQHRDELAVRPQEESRSFLVPSVDSVPVPATGLRGFLQRLGFVSSGPTAAQQQERAQVRAVAQRWPGPRTIAVVNGKGGAGKTPTSCLIAAFFARLGGAGVVAWDCNLTRGTLGWRTEQGPHDATVLDLVPQTHRLLSGGAQSADLAAFVHHQIDDQYDVLRSNPLLLSTQQKLTPEQQQAVHAVLCKFYRLTVIDSGNDEGDVSWLQLVDSADQLVVPTTTRGEHAEAARLLLQGLSERDEESARKARDAVVVISQADKEETSTETVAQGFAPLTRAVVTVPYDPALRQQWLRVDALSPASRSAWLAAAAAVAEGL